MDYIDRQLALWNGELPSAEFGRLLRIVIARKFGRVGCVDEFAKECRVHPDVVRQVLDGSIYPPSAVLEALDMRMSRAFYKRQ